jgi:glycosyltransferase involved in cell wall biosynthesis
MVYNTNHPGALVAASAAQPHVSVLMPTFNQGAFIRRAIEGLRAQTLTDWELVIVDDGSTDATPHILRPYLSDPRVRYMRLEHNEGLGVGLNIASSRARGRYLAYLPSDDLFYPEHLALLAALLDARPEVGLAYSGVRWQYDRSEPTLRGAAAVGHELEALAEPPAVTKDVALPSGNILALVQVMHRRDWPMVRWSERGEIVSDTLEADYWRGLLAAGVRFAYSGAVTCEWVAHPDQRHKLIAGNEGGVARYRSFYGIRPGVYLNFQPSRGMTINEGERYGRFAQTPEQTRTNGGLKILMAGELGFNPERVLALAERGHQLFGMWVERPESWDTVGPLPFGTIEDVPFDRRWVERVRQIGPDLIYGLLNWQAVTMIDTILDADLGIPLVFHFKEGPFICHERGLWPTLMRILERSDGQIFINEECRQWFQLATDGGLDLDSIFILDGDLPKADWLIDDWPVRLSAHDGAIHTVCAGRPLGLDPFNALAEVGIHVHFYGRHFQQWFPHWTSEGLATGYMHLHPTVEPADWVRELGQYDAAWFHVFDSTNGGDLRRARWDDLNLPARLGTYAAAGLPWIIKDAGSSRAALQRIATQHDVGVFFHDFAHLAELLRDRERIAQQAANMRAARHQFAFDTHADALVAFFRRIIAR